jgi:hypothetical protein
MRTMRYHEWYEDELGMIMLLGMGGAVLQWEGKTHASCRKIFAKSALSPQFQHNVVIYSH